MHRTPFIRIGAHIFRLLFPVVVAVGTFLHPAEWGAYKLAIFVSALLLIYGYPLNTAHERRHPNRWKITAVTILLGWTVVGWVVALIWSFGWLDHDSMRNQANPIGLANWKTPRHLALVRIFQKVLSKKAVD